MMRFEELEMVGNQQAWEECDRADRMLRILGRMAGHPGWPSRQQVILLECDCAETVLGFIPEGENRPKQAIIAARTLALGEDISPAQIRAAADAAAAYAVSSSYTDAAYAALAAANAAYAAASYAAASYAADAASTSYAASSYAAASYAASASYAAAADAAAADVAYYAAEADAAAAYEAAYDDYPSEDYAFYAAEAARDKKLRELAELIRPRFSPVSENLGLEREVEGICSHSS